MKLLRPLRKGICVVRDDASAFRHTEGDDVALYKAEGIVLRTRNLGEADRIITLYTREQGKVDCVARGSRRARSRLMGGTQLFTHGRYMLFSGRSLDSLNNAEIKQSFAKLREDLVKLGYASYLAELLDVATEPGEPSEDIFHMILDAFLGLERDVTPGTVARWFEFRLMALLGYEPELEQCVACGGSVAGEVRFSSKEGGLLCSECVGRDRSAIALRRSTVELLKHFVSMEGTRLGIVRPSHGDLALLEEVGRSFVDERLPRPLKSLGFLSSIRDLA